MIKLIGLLHITYFSGLLRADESKGETQLKVRKQSLYHDASKKALKINIMVVKEYLKFSDLEGLDANPNSVRESFKKIFGEKPDGIALNNETYYSAVKPPITEQYGHWCYKNVEGEEIISRDSPKPNTDVLGSNTAYNHGDTDATVQLSVTGKWTDTTGWNASITTGMSFDTKIGVEGVFTFGTSFKIDVTAGTSGSHSVEKSVTSTISVPVKARSKVKVDMVATMREETITYNMPISVRGMMGANFPDRVKGHYFWFSTIEDLVPKTSGDITCKINGVHAMDTHTVVHKAEPIND
ncbi:hydralysin-like [Hydractinia symbiolongicarpus]|uniref:hydralysin-like n=1 Tax=Hydractinia symbiolongicarpus TaxID=13093 RepID=UPI0025508822|nr:hydralysin-like [Hydractinia symbiolongicarpus]